MLPISELELTAIGCFLKKLVILYSKQLKNYVKKSRLFVSYQIISTKVAKTIYLISQNGDSIFVSPMIYLPYHLIRWRFYV
jgi:hypothetical protein